MAMDGLSLAAVVSDLQKLALGAKIEKIYQPERDELMLLLRSGKRLLLSANGSSCRVHLTEEKRVNPQEPPMFCMLMRKYLTNGIIQSVSQPGFDRIVHIEISSTDELGEPCVYTLIAEIMGKHSNVILVKADGTVVDAIRHVTPSVSSVRVLMPGVKYAAPPSQDKKDPRTVSQADVQSALSASPLPLAKAIQSSFFGLSPAVAADVAILSAGDPALRFSELSLEDQARCAQRVHRFFEDVAQQKFQPTLVVNEFGEPVSFFAYSSPSYSAESKRGFETMSQVIDAYVGARDKTERLRQKGASLHKILTNNIERCQKKLAMQHDILLSTEKMEQNRLFGELLTANAYRAQKGARSVQVVNYYDPNQAEIAIPLDPTLSPSANAQKYFKKYNKQKAAFDMADGQIKQIESELAYLEGQLQNLSFCTAEAEISEIRQELIKEGYVRPEKNAKSAPKQAKSKPMHYVSSTGIHIYVGKNNLQNDRLTLKDSDPEHIWMHTKNIPGSHVIVCSPAPDDQTLLEGAMLAAWYSKARNSAQIPVDYTPRKYVKKPPGSRPGFVIYTTNRTIYSTPEEGAVKSLTRVE